MKSELPSQFKRPCLNNYHCKNDNVELYSRDQDVEYVKCNSCGLIWRDLSVSDNIHEYGESYFKQRKYSERMSKRVRHSHLFLAMLEQFDENDSKGSFLEIGPGVGEAMFAARQRGWFVEGLDLSDYVVKMCTGLGFKMHNGELGKNDITEVASIGYDAIFMKHVLEHYKNPFEALKDSHRLLKRNGLIQIIVPNSEYSRAEKLRGKHHFFRKDGDGSEHYVYFNSQTLKDILEFSGFEILQSVLPFRLQNPDSTSQNLELMIRKAVPLFGARREAMVIARKI